MELMLNKISNWESLKQFLKDFNFYNAAFFARFIFKSFSDYWMKQHVLFVFWKQRNKFAQIWEEL